MEQVNNTQQLAKSLAQGEVNQEEFDLEVKRQKVKIRTKRNKKPWLKRLVDWYYNETGRD